MNAKKQPNSLCRWWGGRTKTEKDRFASGLGITYNACSAICNNPDAKHSESRCLNIERLTGGEVTAEELNKRIDWVFVKAERARLSAETAPVVAGNG